MPDPNERTFWLVCKPVQSGYPDIPDDEPPHTPACADAAPMKYRSYPIRVASYFNTALGSLQTRETVRQWNEWLGSPMLRVVEWEYGVKLQADVWLDFSPFEDGGFLGMAEPIYDVLSDDWECTAHVWDPNVSVIRTAQHELGHCLGLSHDGTDYLDNDYDVPWSVMKQGTKLTPHRLTAADRAALRGLYLTR